MRALVTGCAGLIGWKVSQLLMDQGHNVVGVDNLNDAYDVTLKKWRLDQLKVNSDFEFHKLDCADRTCLSSLPSPEKLDAVINLAARAGVRHSIEDPWVYYDTNVTGTLNLLDLCRENNISKFVLASSSSVYGDGERPSLEDGPTDRPQSPYAASKKAAEGLAYAYHHNHGTDVTALRYFTVYGPAGRPDMAVFRFLKWIDSGEPVIVYGDGSQQRDFTYVEDIARGTVAALKPLGYEVINLGNDKPASVRQLITMLEGLLEREADVDYQPANAADVDATWADISKAKSLLDWAPLTGLEEGLARTVEWYRQNRHWAKKIRL